MKSPKKPRRNTKKLETLPQEKKIAVYIDSRTTIYIKEGKDPEEAKRKFMEIYRPLL